MRGRVIDLVVLPDDVQQQLGCSSTQIFRATLLVPRPATVVPPPNLFQA